MERKLPRDSDGSSGSRPQSSNDMSTGIRAREGSVEAFNLLNERIAELELQGVDLSSPTPSAPQQHESTMSFSPSPEAPATSSRIPASNQPVTLGLLGLLKPKGGQKDAEKSESDRTIPEPPKATQPAEKRIGTWKSQQGKDEYIRKQLEAKRAAVASYERNVASRPKPGPTMVELLQMSQPELDHYFATMPGGTFQRFDAAVMAKFKDWSRRMDEKRGKVQSPAPNPSRFHYGAEAALSTAVSEREKEKKLERQKKKLRTTETISEEPASSEVASGVIPHSAFDVGSSSSAPQEPAASSSDIVPRDRPQRAAAKSAEEKIEAEIAKRASKAAMDQAREEIEQEDARAEAEEKAARKAAKKARKTERKAAREAAKGSTKVEFGSVDEMDDETFKQWLKSLDDDSDDESAAQAPQTAKKTVTRVDPAVRQKAEQEKRWAKMRAEKARQEVEAMKAAQLGKDPSLPSTSSGQAAASSAQHEESPEIPPPQEPAQQQQVKQESDEEDDNEPGPSNRPRRGRKSHYRATSDSPDRKVLKRGRKPGRKLGTVHKAKPIISRDSRRATYNAKRDVANADPSRPYGRRLRVSEKFVDVIPYINFRLLGHVWTDHVDVQIRWSRFLTTASVGHGQRPPATVTMTEEQQSQEIAQHLAAWNPATHGQPVRLVNTAENHNIVNNSPTTTQVYFWYNGRLAKGTLLMDGDNLVLRGDKHLAILATRRYEIPDCPMTAVWYAVPTSIRMFPFHPQLLKRDGRIGMEGDYRRLPPFAVGHNAIRKSILTVPHAPIPRNILHYRNHHQYYALAWYSAKVNWMMLTREELDEGMSVNSVTKEPFYEAKSQEQKLSANFILHPDGVIFQRIRCTLPKDSKYLDNIKAVQPSKMTNEAQKRRSLALPKEKRDTNVVALHQWRRVGYVDDGRVVLEGTEYDPMRFIWPNINGQLYIDILSLGVSRAEMPHPLLFHLYCAVHYPMDADAFDLVDETNPVFRENYQNHVLRRSLGKPETIPMTGETLLMLKQRELDRQEALPAAFVYQSKLRLHPVYGQKFGELVLELRERNARNRILQSLNANFEPIHGLNFEQKVQQHLANCRAERNSYLGQLEDFDDLKKGRDAVFRNYLKKIAANIPARVSVGEEEVHLKDGYQKEQFPNLSLPDGSDSEGGE